MIEARKKADGSYFFFIGSDGVILTRDHAERFCKCVLRMIASEGDDALLEGVAESGAHATVNSRSIQ